MSINSLLNTSNQALQAFQFAIDLAGANIANVNTPGYARQRAVFQSVGTVDVASVRAQVGIEVSGVERIYDAYLNNQVADQAQVVGYNEAKSDLLDRVESIFAESGGGAGELLNKFWNAWSELAANPKGQIERENLLAAADSLAAKLRGLDGDLDKAVQDAGDNIAVTLSQVNDYLSQIAELNNKIVTGGSDANGNSNGLRDQRGELLHQLSRLIDINYLETANGVTNVFLANGKPLLAGENVWQLAYMERNGAIDIVYQDNPVESLKQTLLQGKKGKLAALLEIGEVIVPDYKGKLNALATVIVSEVNIQHRAGYDNSGNGGGDFFTAATEARDFRVTAAIMSDVNKIAASSTVNSDGDNALALGAIKGKLAMNGGTATINDNYKSLIGRIGRDVANAKSSLTHQTAIMEQLSNRREATSGVSLDEEMMNLMKYQMSYNSTGKLVATASQMMDTLLQLVK